MLEHIDRVMLNKYPAIMTVFSFCSIPFSTEDISKAIPRIDPIDIELPQFLHHPPSAQVLQQFELTPS